MGSRRRSLVKRLLESPPAFRRHIDVTREAHLGPVCRAALVLRIRGACPGLRLGVRVDLPTAVEPLRARDGRPERGWALDFVVTNDGSNSISALLGDGAGGFAPKLDFATAAQPVALALADLNGDGRIDAVVANYNSSSVSVLLGNGGGGFGPKADFPTGVNPSSVVIGDPQRRRRPDLVVGNYGSSTVSVLLATARAASAPDRPCHGRQPGPVRDRRSDGDAPSTS